MPKADIIRDIKDSKRTTVIDASANNNLNNLAIALITLMVRNGLTSFTITRSETEDMPDKNLRLRMGNDEMTIFIEEAAEVTAALNEVYPDQEPGGYNA